MGAVLEQKDAGDWVYRGEGAFNIVLAYNGCSPNFIGKVLRVQKAPREGSQGYIPENNQSVLTKYERLVWKEYKELVCAPTQEIVDQLYVQNVICPLLGSEHVDAGIQVPVSKEFLETIEENVLPQRPSWRVEAAKVNTLCGSALLLSDHSVFPHPHGNIKEELCITVEIKPKCGFVPDSEFISEENAVKKRVSRFRMHQLLKLQKKEASEISEYDPLHMFSGSKERVYEAINALFNTPQNNFRVFLNGILIVGGLGGGTSSTTCVIGEAFEDALRCMIHTNEGSRIKKFLQLVAKVLLTSGLLDRLLKAQKLDSFDIEGTIHAYYDIISQPCLVCRDLGEDTLLGKFKYLHSMNLEEKLKIVRNYLIAATAKDLSMMISFRPREFVDEVSPYNSVFLESTNQTFDYKASFIDLDMKPLKKMEYYYELDQKIVKYYSEMMKKEGMAQEAGRVEANGTVQ